MHTLSFRSALFKTCSAAARCTQRHHTYLPSPTAQAKDEASQRDDLLPAPGSSAIAPVHHAPPSNPSRGLYIATCPSARPCCCCTLHPSAGLHRPTSHGLPGDRTAHDRQHSRRSTLHHCTVRLLHCTATHASLICAPTAAALSVASRCFVRLPRCLAATPSTGNRPAPQKVTILNLSINNTNATPAPGTRPPAPRLANDGCRSSCAISEYQPAGMEQ